MNTPTPRTDALGQSGTAHYTALAFAGQLERELTHAIEEANNWKEATEAHLKDKEELRAELKLAVQLLTRCRNAAGRMEIDLYEDIQNFIQP
jgi:hypothetical protein